MTTTEPTTIPPMPSWLVLTPYTSTEKLEQVVAMTNRLRALREEIETVVGDGEILPADYVGRVYGVRPERLCLLKIRGDSMDGSPAWIELSVTHQK